MTLVIGWDLSTKLCGWCAGTGAEIPSAGAFRLVERDDLGLLGCDFQANVLAVHARFPATHWTIEQPLLLPHDARWTLERIYGVTMLIHTLARKLGIISRAVGVAEVKSELAGRNASKDDMVRMAEKIGVILPVLDTDGRKDAADATGAWKVGIRLFAKQHLTRWDQAIYSNRGGLV